MNPLLRFALPFVLACAPQAWADDTVGFGARVVPILEKYCVQCHVPDDDQGGLSLLPDPWQALVGVPSRRAPLNLVEPGIPEKSYLYLKLLGTHEVAGGRGRRMPIEQEPLGAADMETVRQWIAQGAKKD